MKKNKVFYGEYSLKHWIDLILQKDIIIPEYQRYFVWKEEQVQQLVIAIQEEQFIPPVTIGFYNGKNLIIDGQQRLTSLLLSYLSIFPDREKFKKISENLYSQSESDENKSSNEEELEDMIEWKFGELTKLGKTKEEIKNKIGEYYKPLVLPINLSDEFLNNNFLGFSYIIPNTSDEQYINRYFSSLFKNMNTRGSPLTLLESRESLYYIRAELQSIFKPKFITDFKVNGNTIDFVRILSFLFQYKKDNDIYNLAKGYIRGKKKLENYYEEYIFDVINDNDSLFGKFSDFFPKMEYIEYIEEIENTLINLNIPKKLLSIIDVDIYFFGLVYFVLIEKKIFNKDKLKQLSLELKKEIDDIKLQEKDNKNPNQISKIKIRLKKSIDIYEKGLANE